MSLDGQAFSGVSLENFLICACICCKVSSFRYQLYQHIVPRLARVSRGVFQKSQTKVSFCCLASIIAYNNFEKRSNKLFESKWTQIFTATTYKEMKKLSLPAGSPSSFWST